MDGLIAGLGRVPRQRTTLYADAPMSRRRAAAQATALEPLRLERRRTAAVA
jgi:hypothetical protein